LVLCVCLQSDVCSPYLRRVMVLFTLLDVFITVS